MLSPISRSEVPRYRGTEVSPMRRFAAETVDEFVSASAVGDVMEVTGWPDATNAVEKCAAAIRSELFYRDRTVDWRDAVRVMTRSGERVFLERTREAPKRELPGRL